MHGPRESGPYVEMTLVDATARGLVDGQDARVFNASGELVLPVKISNRLLTGVVGVPFGWWDADFSGGQNVNDLTSDAATDWGGGVAYHDTLVEVSSA
jgi:anaerobic selenocysteine-containing dehydrogenase